MSSVEGAEADAAEAAPAVDERREAMAEKLRAHLGDAVLETFTRPGDDALSELVDLDGLGLGHVGVGGVTRRQWVPPSSEPRCPRP